MKELTKEEVFDAWAPSASAWSRWVKPVLFAHVGERQTVSTSAPPELPRWAPSTDRNAVILDLPGEEGVHVGLALAAAGFRPIPLYNGLPAAAVLFSGRLTTPRSAVEVRPLIDALALQAGALTALALVPHAPPVFLLDARRRGTWFSGQPGTFDNRSVYFESDFPSAKFFLRNGIENIQLVQRNRTYPQPDLDPILRRWAAEGLSINALRLDQPERVEAQPLPARFSPRWWLQQWQARRGVVQPAFGHLVPWSAGG